MTFEGALRTELSSISGLENKVFPIVAPKGENSPFVVYRKGNVKFAKALDGIQNKVEANYVIVIIGDTYASLQQIYDAVIDLLNGFLGRNIGIDGPLIKNVTVEVIGDQYEPDVEFFRSDIQLKVNY